MAGSGIDLGMQVCHSLSQFHHLWGLDLFSEIFPVDFFPRPTRQLKGEIPGQFFCKFRGLPHEEAFWEDREEIERRGFR